MRRVPATLMRFGVLQFPGSCDEVDALNAARRSLPMVKVEKDYVFDGPRGPVTLTGLFGSCRQGAVA